MLSKRNMIIIGSISLIALAVTIGVVVVIKRIKNKGLDKRKVDKNKNYIIGDSQTPFLDQNSERALRINNTGSPTSLWKGGINLNWLKDSVANYPISEDVNTIVVNIGTNGKFNKNDDVSGLISTIKGKFPNANLLAVKGSWGWGGNKDVTTDLVNNYYKRFDDNGVDVIDVAIGSVKDPHSNLPIYKEIGKIIDQKINKND
tara:strand:- start:1337 stop:1942 length:606 start_codon:yes stop_codon:yes gene_type:complete